MKLLLENWNRYLNEELLVESFEDALVAIQKKSAKLIKGWAYQNRKEEYDAIENNANMMLSMFGHVKDDTILYGWDIAGYMLASMLNSLIIPNDITDKQKAIALYWNYKQFVENKFIPKDETESIINQIVDSVTYFHDDLARKDTIASILVEIEEPIYEFVQAPIETGIGLHVSTPTAGQPLSFTDEETYSNISDMSLMNIFESYFHWSRFIAEGKKDLNSISGYNELYRVVDDAAPLYFAWQEKQQQKDVEAGKEFLLKNNEWIVYAIHNKGAALEFGKGSDLCTAAPGLNFFQQYYRPNDPLFAIIDVVNDKRYQFSFTNKDFKYIKPNKRGGCATQTQLSKEELHKIMFVLSEVVPPKYDIAYKELEKYR